MTGPRPDRKRWTDSEDQQLLSLFEAGLSATEVARKLKRPVGAVRSRKPRLTPRAEGAETPPKLNMAHRQILHHLRSGEWKFATKLPVLASENAVEKMLATGWLERRGPDDKLEIRLTAAGLDALKAPVRQF